VKAKLVLIGALVVALAAFAVPAETWAQGGSAKAKAQPKPEEVYGDQGGEKVLPADTRLPGAVMRARLEDTFFKLSNPRIDEKRNALLLDYEVVSKGKFEGGVLVFRGPDGSKAEIALTSLAGRDSGTIQLVGGKQFGSFRFRTKIQFPEDVEMYVMRSDDRYDPPLKCMVSNAVVMGRMKSLAKARNWTAKEFAQYTRPPLAYKNPNAYPEVGEDVPALPAGGGQFRFVDPEGRLLGLDYAMGSWDNKPAFGGLTPVFSMDQPKQHTTRSIAKKGYAVAGAELNVDKYVCGIRLFFQRVKADGSFDTKDAYASPWLGVAPTGKSEPTKLVNDGRRVLGIHIQRGAVVDRFALVAEGEK
jgi:hypothetical protein